MSIKTVHLVCFQRYDVGYEKPAYTMMEEQKKTIAQAVSRILEEKDHPVGFCWVCQASAPVYEYLKQADDSAKKAFLEAISCGRLEVCGLSHNLSAIAGENEIRKSVDWLPAELWGPLNISSVMQCDVGGVSQAAAAKLCKKGVRWLWAELDADHMHLKKEMPFWFYWRFSVKERLFVFADESSHEFKRMLLGETEDLKGGVSQDCGCVLDYPNFFDVDDVTLINRQAVLKQTLDRMEQNLSDVSVLPMVCNLSAPQEVAGLCSFVRRWNHLNLSPRLQFSTVSHSLHEWSTELINQNIPTYTGAWADALAAGCISLPRELALYREAQRKYHSVVGLCQKADGTFAPRQEKMLDQACRDLCVFAENTFSDGAETGRPWMFADAALHAKQHKLFTASSKLEQLYRDQAEELFGHCTEDGIYLFNASMCPYSGLVCLPAEAIGQVYQYVLDSVTGKHSPLYYEGGCAYFSVQLQPKERVQYTFCDEDYIVDCDVAGLPAVKTDSQGYPCEIQWSDGSRFGSEMLGNFEAVGIDSETKRDVIARIFYEKNKVTRSSLVQHYSLRQPTQYGRAVKTELEHAFVFEQSFIHPYLRSGSRRCVVWKKQPRISVSITLDRIPDTAPQAFYAVFSMPQAAGTAVSSSGGRVFEVGRGQIDGTYADAVCCDGWIAYPYDRLLFLQRDSSVVCFGADNFLAFRDTFCPQTNQIYVNLFNNVIGDRYQTDYTGVQTFAFDLFVNTACDDFYKNRIFAETVYTEPVKYIRLKDRRHDG